MRTVDTLRSDFASLDAKTYVELEFLHKGQKYTVTRNPKYERPKKNGTGFTNENADAALILPSGQVVAGNNKVTEEIVELLGIDYKQFKQIAMIAQGEFLRLLLAESSERAGIFRKVFNTDIYDTIQEVLKRREKELKGQFDESTRSILEYMDDIQYAEDRRDYPLKNIFEQDIPYDLVAVEALVRSDLDKTREQKKEQTVVCLDLETKSDRRKECIVLLKQSEEAIKQTDEEYSKKDELKGTLQVSLGSVQSEINTLQAALEYSSSEIAKKIIDQKTKELNELKQALQDAEKTYQENKQLLDGNIILLNDQEKRKEALSETVNQTLSAYTAKYMESGFNDEVSYHGSLMTEQALSELNDRIRDYRDACKSTKADIERLSKETKDKQPKDTAKIIEEQRALQIEKDNLDNRIQRLTVRIEKNEATAKAIAKKDKERKQLEKDYLVVLSLSKTANGELTAASKN